MADGKAYRNEVERDGSVVRMIWVRILPGTRHPGGVQSALVKDWSFRPFPGYTWEGRKPWICSRIVFGLTGFSI